MKEFSFKINGQEYKTTVEEIEAGKAAVTVNGKKYEVEVPQQAHTAAARPSASAHSTAAAPAKSAAAPQGGMQVKSPLPGSIIKVLVSVGQAVKKGDTLLTLESMKMENTVAAECDGTVKQVAVQPGQNVMQDDLLVVLG